MTSQSPNLTTEAVREQLRTARGPDLWRSIDQLADTDAFREFVEREFPRGASELADGVTRRTFLKLMGASLALAGVTGCTYMPREKLAPFVEQPQGGRVPGIALYYASTLTLNGYGSGVLVRSNEGRPTKIEGNPRHPGSLGGTDLFAQAEVLTLYDPDRSTQVLNRNAPSSWDNLATTLGNSLTAQNAVQGAGIRLLTTTVTSPTLASQIAQFLTRYPQARWYQYDPINNDNAVAGGRLAFNEDVTTRYDFSAAQVVLSLDADFLAPGPGFNAYARTFADGRRVTKESTTMNRLYVVEATPSSTGITADHRLALKATQVEHVARALASALGVSGVPAGAALSPTAQAFVQSVAADLRANQGASLVIPGAQQSPAVHAIAHAINAALGNVGSTVVYTAPVEARPTVQTSELVALVNEIAAEQVELLVMLDGNPAYNAPGDLRFAERLARVPLSVHLSLFVDETSQLATWHVPMAHALESWSDARAYDGTASIVQPLIEPLYGGKTSHELLALLLGNRNVDLLNLVQTTWQSRANGNFDLFWQTSLSNGVIADTAAPTVTPTLQSGAVPPAPAELSGLELVFRPDGSLWDGRYANNGWLMELPRPVTQIVWDNAALMSPRTAIRLLGLPISVDQLIVPDGVKETEDEAAARERSLELLTQANGSVVRINYRGGSMELPVWLTPGHAEDSVTVLLGYGRSGAGRVGDNIGVNVYPVRTSDAPWFGGDVAVSATGRTYQLVSTQNHWTMEGRDIYRVGTFAMFSEDPKSISRAVYNKKYGLDAPNYQRLQPGVDYSGRNKWGMTINLNACIGCNACVVACQSENNIPVVGKDQVAVGREMHWIRIDRYFAGKDLDNPSTYVMPLTCMQCENAPCEVVCPVAATVHDYEGINNMVYNRCVGTKYCSNNCPYKVRRFNFLQYSDVDTITLQLMRNPEVTVRNRGVMEKCTYCVQRISDARIEAKKAAVAAGQTEYTIADGAIVTACEGACPTAAITFGDLNDSSSRVAKWRGEGHNYYFLGELNTIPRTTYLARVRNPNTDLELEG
jgi:molybdopterin-containing oxidoreductase family iron-sulfur binding subunit